MINQQIKYFFKKFCFGIVFSHYFKHLDNMWKIDIATLCVGFPQIQSIDLSEVVQNVKVHIIVISVHVKLSTLFMVSHVLSAWVSPEWRLNPGFGTQKKCPFP